MINVKTIYNNNIGIISTYRPFKLNDIVTIINKDTTIDNYVNATVIGLYSTTIHIILGYKSKPSSNIHVLDIAHLPTTAMSSDLTLVSDWESYSYFIVMYNSNLRLVQIDLSCKVCNTIYPQSQPNQSDGSLICWSCRDAIQRDFK